MRRQSFQMAALGGVIALVVLFGIDIATSGVERINGPMDNSSAPTVGRFDDSYNEQSAYRASEAGGSDERLQAGGGYAPESRARSVEEAERERNRSGSRSDSAQDKAPEAVPYDRLPGVPEMRHDTSVNKLADGTAGLLQSVSSRGIRMVVSLFESIAD